MHNVEYDQGPTRLPASMRDCSIDIHHGIQIAEHDDCRAAHINSIPLLVEMLNLVDKNEAGHLPMWPSSNTVP